MDIIYRNRKIIVFETKRVLLNYDATSANVERSFAIQYDTRLRMYYNLIPFFAGRNMPQKGWKNSPRTMI